MPVAVQNEKASDTSRIWFIVSRVAAAVLGGYVVTYWAGAAVAKMAMEWDLLSRADAGMFSGLVQLVVYVVLIIWVCAMASMRKAWVVLAMLTTLLVGCHRADARTTRTVRDEARSGDRIMEKSFTQRMDWLHTWFGLVLGWLAFALFLTGTIAVFWFEIQHWAQPELHGAKMLSTRAPAVQRRLSPEGRAGLAALGRPPCRTSNATRSWC